MGEKVEILSLDGASKFLKIGKKTLYNLVKEGTIPGRKIGREWRFVKSVLVDWVSQMNYLQKPCWEIKNCPEKKKYNCVFYRKSSIIKNNYIS